MLIGTLRGPLGDFRTDFVAAATPFVGAAKANELIVGAENLIKNKATEGVLAAKPQIIATVQTKVTSIVLPMFLGAAALGLVGTGLAIAALAKLKKRG